MNLQTILPPSPGKIYTSFLKAVPNSNLYLIKSYDKISYTNMGVIFQVTLMILFYSIMYTIKDEKEKPFIKKDEPNTYWNTLKNRSKVLGLFVKNNTPIQVKLCNIIQYVSLTFGINAVFYMELPVQSVSDFVLISLPATVWGLAINIGMQIPVAKFMSAYENEDRTQLKANMKKFWIISTVYMVISTYFCSIFCMVRPEFQANWLRTSCFGLFKTFCNCFWLSFVSFKLSEYSNKDSSKEIGETKKQQ